MYRYTLFSHNLIINIIPKIKLIAWNLHELYMMEAKNICNVKYLRFRY